jgi:hypothetical protein
MTLTLKSARSKPYLWMEAKRMTTELKHRAGRGLSGWRVAAWSIPVLLLLLPFVAMRFTAEVNWTASDFVFAGVLFGSVGLGLEFTVRKSESMPYRLGAALAVFASFLTIWVNAAVGMIGNGPYNLLFGGVLLIALVWAIAARFEPAGMARAMVAAAIAQAVLSTIGFLSDPLGGSLSLTFALLWLGAAWLFRKAEREKAIGRSPV